MVTLKPPSVLPDFLEESECCCYGGWRGDGAVVDKLALTCSQRWVVVSILSVEFYILSFGVKCKWILGWSWLDSGSFAAVESHVTIG